ncbi:MAG: hypothetical protein Kow0010_22530 [Dehalococcoidia bacterium]
MNRTTYDLVIVGGGIAGASVATVMARAGHTVLVIERERVFRDRVRGEFLSPWGVGALRSVGLMDTVTAAGAVPLPALAGRSLKPRPVRSPEGDVPLSFSHVAVQEALLTEAAASGAEVVRGARVTSVTGDGEGRVEFATPDGTASVSARLVVGADGRSSLARRALGQLECVNASERVLAGVRLSNVAADPAFGYFIIREEAGGLASVFPQGDGMARAYIFLYGQDASTYAGPGGYERFIQGLLDLGVPAEVLEHAQQAGPLASFAAADSWVNHPASDHIVLVGDAAGISDPTWGQGLALVFHDVRVLTETLLGASDWREAAHRYADERSQYFHTVITAESWLTELQLSSGPEAEARRAHVMRAWRAEPDRARGLDLNGYGPALDVSDEARRRVFAEDVPAMAADPTPVQPPASSTREEVATAFLSRLAARDFDALGAMFSDTARMRALLPGGPIEVLGGSAAGKTFAKWYGTNEEFEVLATSYDTIADRLKMTWRCRLRWEGETFSRMIEQQAYAKVVDGRIVVLDLVCSGFRPVPEVDAQAAA